MASNDRSGVIMDAEVLKLLKESLPVMVSNIDRLISAMRKKSTPRKRTLRMIFSVIARNLLQNMA
ncbi:hypothetical protein CWS02_04925 [Enterobacter sp. EA-1]|nr:hypothetical protein CWS02_04925 [Enterobacter sp. EA-1]